MTTALCTLTELESPLESELRVKVLAEIERRAMSERDLADLLGIYPLAVRALVLEHEWDWPTAIRIANALGMRVEMNVVAM